MEYPTLPTSRITVSATTILKIAFLGLLFYWLVFYLFDIVLVIVSSVIIASSIEPMVKWFIERRIPRIIAVLLIYAGVAIVFVGTFYFLLLPLLSEIQELTTTLAASGIPQTGLGGSIPGLDPSFSGIIDNLPVSEILVKANNLMIALSQNAFTTASLVLGGLLNFILIVVLSFYLSVQAGGITNFLRIIIPSTHRRYVIGLWNRAEQKIGLWLQGQLLLGVIVAVLVYLILTLLGVKHAILLAFLAGIFELIPLFGPIMAAIPAIFFGYSTGGVTMALVVTGFYVIIQQFESQLIYPLVVKKVIGVPPIISILALVIGAKLAGFLGILIAVPIATIIMELFHDLERNRAEEEKTK
ncbi:MAG TPA: AI-2E family transporter [Candidatus Nanoarchaeia archaeon]|nr:AI-2E family transporter [Candidatus Nanoarchaeia archaeon]